MDIRSGSRGSALFLISGAVLLFFGCLVYLLFRHAAFPLLQSLPLAETIAAVLPHAHSRHSWTDWAPSFIHVLSFSLITAGLLGPGLRARYAIPSAWLFISIAFELGQKYRLTISSVLPTPWMDMSAPRLIDAYFRTGTFDPADVAAAFAGFLAAVLFVRPGSGTASANGYRIAIRYLRPVLTGLVFSFGILCILATSQARKCDYDPVYLSYEELRKPVTGTAPEPVSGGGKIYLYGDYLLVNQLNKGIHVINNTNPDSPVNLAFIPVPGNMDIAVKDNILYADSYIDLVAVDISDMGNIHEVKRVKGIFAYNPFQNVTDSSSYLCSFDEQQGVVVDVRRRL